MSPKVQNVFSQCIKAILLFFIFSLRPASSSDSHYMDNWGVTQVKVKKITYTWTISNFTFCDRDTGEMIESPTFFSDESDEYKWRLRLYPKGYNSDYGGYITLFLKLVAGHNRIKVGYKFAILSSDNREINSKSITTNFAKDNVYGYYEFIPRSYVFNRENNVLPDDKLTITAEIIMNQGLVNISGGCGTINSATQLGYTHANNFEKLLGNELFSDVELIVNPYEFLAHKAILAAVSPVFLEQFTKNPNATNIYIHVEAGIFKEVLRFIYTGKIHNIEKIAKDVLPVANEYQIEPLKSMCEEVICQSLNATNAIDVLMLAEQYNAIELRRQASNFITAHALKVVDTPGFKAMEVSRPHPILEIFRTLVEKSEK